MSNSYDSREASVAESEQMSSGISHGLRGESDNESNVISVFHGIYVSQREIVHTDTSSQSHLHSTNYSGGRKVNHYKFANSDGVRKEIF
jgi:hypothetical protein